jgi:hypothetical protein
MKCNFCHHSEFKDPNNSNAAICAKCGSYIRTRLTKLHVDDLLEKGKIDASFRVLHVAPECLLSVFLKNTFSDYVAIDFDVQRYSHIAAGVEFFDLCDFASYEDLGRFDLIIHNHVIEHLPCNYAVVLIKLHQILSERGYQLFSVPIYGKFFSESLERLSPEEATRRFGQFDHVRKFSPPDIRKTIGAIFRLDGLDDMRGSIAPDKLLDANIPQVHWAGFNGHTVFSLMKTDILV